MQVTISITKGTDVDKFNAKFGTSRGGGQTRIKNVTLNDVGEKLTELLKEANNDGFIGKK